MKGSAVLLVAGAALVAFVSTACSGDDDAATTTTTPVVTTSVAPSTTAATTAPTVTTAPPTTTEPTSTTSPEDALKAQIAADYVASTDRYFELVNQPSLDGLEERAAHVAAPGSPYYDVVIAKLQQLVTLGDRIVPNDPPIRKVIVEHVELVGPPPYSKADITVCAVDNGLQVTPPEHTPDSQQVIEGGTGELLATRSKQEVWQTTQGWLPTLKFDDADQAWTGVDSCPAE